MTPAGRRLDRLLPWLLAPLGVTGLGVAYSAAAIPIDAALSGGASYRVVDLGPHAFNDVAGTVVPVGRVYLLGDNRDQSADSRVPVGEMGLGGAIPIASIIGRAERITYSMDGGYRLRQGRSGLSLRPEHLP